MKRLRVVLPLFAICVLLLTSLWGGYNLARDFNSALKQNTLSQQNITSQIDLPDKILKKQGKYAVAFVVAGCSSTRGTSMNLCVPYVLNAIVAAHVLRKFQSSIDVVLKVRMAASSNDTSFAPEIEEWLSKVGVKLSYLPKVRRDNFGTSSIEMFRILEMVEYDRVLFMDSDSYPVCNIERHFDLSFDGLLDEMVAFKGGSAPITAAALMVTPKLGAFGQVMDIIHRCRNISESKNKLDPIRGWGHPIVNETGHVVKEWTWYAANGDQGVLYEWLMHEVKNFTLITAKGYRTYREVVGNSTNHMISFLANKTKPLISSCRGGNFSEGTLYQAIQHFSGGGKPWGHGGIGKHTTEEAKPFSKLSNIDKWRYYVSEANRTFSLHLPSRIPMTAKPPSGGDIRGHVLLSPDVEIPVPLKLEHVRSGSNGNSNGK